jgi:hypothetical protein
MRDVEDKIIFAFYGVFGATIGFVIFAFALGGWRFLLTDRPAKPWNGLAALIVCVCLGGSWGLLSYKYKDRDLGSGPSALYENGGTGILFVKRLMVIATCLAALYFIWQLAKGL